MELEISKVGERGQVTIPLDFREKLSMGKGEKVVFIKEEDSLILKSARKIKSLERLREDLIDAKIADLRLKEMENEEVITQTADEFLKDLEKWAKE